MSAESMTDFVRELFQRSEDYKSLTQSDIRQEYMQHIGVTSLNEENKSLLREIVEILVLEMMYNEEKTGFCKDDGTIVEGHPEGQMQDTGEGLLMTTAPTTVILTQNTPMDKKCLSAKDVTSAILASDLEVELEEVCDGNCSWPTVSLGSAVPAAKPVEPVVPQVETPSPAKKAKVRFIYKNVNKKQSPGKSEHDDSGDPLKKYSHLFTSKSKSQSSGKGWVVINLNSDNTTHRRIDIVKTTRKRPVKSKPKKLKPKEIAKKTIQVLESGSESGDEIVKRPSAKAKQKKAEKKDAHVRHLEKIARTCGILPVGKNYKSTFENCMTCKERVEKLIQLLRDAGMTGPITMKNAKEFKLKLEAEELERDLKEKKITVTEGRGHRNVFSIYSRHAYEPKPLRSASPIKSRLSHLKGIVDSEESSSD